MKVLIVEDEMLLAMELQWELEAAGHTVVGQAASGAQAMELLENSPPEFAFVDIQLQDGPKGIDFGRALAERSIPYVFVSGNIKKLPPDFAGAMGAIEKPYTMNGIANALEYISAVVAGNQDRPPPASLVLAVEYLQINSTKGI